MSWSFDDALVVPARNELAEWLIGAPGVPLQPPTDVRGYGSRFDLVRLTGLSAFWQEGGRGTLTKAISNLCSGLWRLGTSLLVTVQRQGDDLSFLVGISAGGRGGGLAGVSGPVITAALPNASIATPADRTHLQRLFRDGGAIAVVGTPRVAGAPPERTLLDVLSETSIDRWTLTVEADPVARDVLMTRRETFEDRLAELSAAIERTVRVTATETRSERDVRTEHLSSMLRRERDRADAMTRRGGYLVTAWLSADDPMSLTSLAAITSGVLSPTQLEPRGIALIPARIPGVAAGSVLSSDELAAFVQPPSHDVRGLHVSEWARFDAGLEDPVPDASRRLSLGVADSGAVLEYPHDRLTAHALVTGITGSGKSSFLASVIDELESSSVGVLVIEPTKDEYRRLPSFDPSRCWTVGDPAHVGERYLNPFEVATGVPVQTHVDLLVGLFRTSFSLMPPLPFVLEMAIRRAYEDRGWDLAQNINRFGTESDTPTFPSLSEVLRLAERIIEELGYEGDVRHNVTGAIRARLGSLVVGSRGATLDTDRPSRVNELFDGSFLVNLDLLGSDEEKSFFMGLLLIRLWETRRGRHKQELQHVLVLEEAHRILKRSAAASAEEPSGAFASEMFGNLLAEVRAAGQGIILVDQSPRKLSADALANTALKIAFRTTYGVDKAELASALNLDDVQQRALTGLRNHTAVVFWEGMDRPVKASMSHTFPPPDREASPDGRLRIRGLTARGAEESRLMFPELLGHAELMLMVEPVNRAKVVADAKRLMSALYPGRDFDTEAALVFMSGILVERLGQRRRWSFSSRDRLRAAAETGAPTRRNAREALLDGRKPLRMCHLVCPSGGCLVREPVQDIVTEGHLGARQGLELLRGPTPRARAVLEGMLGVLGQPDLAGGVAQVARGCLLTHLVDGHASEGEVNDLLERLG